MIWTTSTFSPPSSRLNWPHSRWLGVVGLVFVSTATLACQRQTGVSVQDIHSWVFSPAAGAQEVAEKVRKQILPQLVKMDDAFAKRLGFDSASEVTNPLSLLVLAPPFAVFHVGLKQLQDFQPGQQNPAELLMAEMNWFRTPEPVPTRFLFPIKAGREVRTSVMVSLALSGNKWNIQSIGSPELIKQLTSNGSGGTHFAVWIPDLNAYYVGKIDEHAVFTMKAIFPDPIVKIDQQVFQKGQKASATTVFEQLQKEAIKIKLNDPNQPRR